MKNIFNKNDILQKIAICNPKQVTIIDLSNLNISDIQDLEFFQFVNVLNLPMNKLTDLPRLYKNKRLQKIDLSFNQIQKIHSLQAQKQLQELYLQSNNIYKIQNISFMTKLQVLNLSYNNITSTKGIDNLKQLTILILSHNQLKDFHYIPHRMKVTHLDIRHNYIVQMKGMQNWKDLQRFQADHNKLKNVKWIQKTAMINYFSVSNNQIEIFQPSITLKQLEYLDLSGNRISLLPPFSTLSPQLETLNLAQNYIPSQHQLIYSIASLQFLNNIDIRGNPIDTQQFEINLGKVYQFDMINGKQYHGQRLYKRKNELQEQQQGGIIVLSRQSGVYNLINQMKQYKNKILTSDKIEEEITTANRNIQKIRNQYLIIMKIKPQTTKKQKITHLNQIQYSPLPKETHIEDKFKTQLNLANDKWKQLKNSKLDKQFNIRKNKGNSLIKNGTMGATQQLPSINSNINVSKRMGLKGYSPRKF